MRRGFSRLALALYFRVIDAADNVSPSMRIVRRLEEQSDTGMWLPDVDTPTAVKGAVKRATDTNANNPQSSSHIVVIVILVVVIVGAIPLLYFCWRMFYRIWKHPTVSYESAALDDEEMVNVDGGGLTSLNGKPKTDAHALSPSEVADARTSTFSHSSQPSISVTSSSEEEHRGLLHQSHFSQPPSPPPTQANDISTKAPAANRKPPPSLMSLDSSPPGSQTQPQSSSPAVHRPNIGARVPMQSPKQSSVSSPSQGFVAPGPPPPMLSSATRSPPRQIRNPYRDELPHQQPQQFPSSVPEPIGPPPQVPPIFTSPPVTPSTSEGSPRSPAEGSRPMGPRRPGGARLRAEATSLLSTISVTSESTTSEHLAGMSPLQHQRGPLSPVRVRA